MDYLRNIISQLRSNKSLLKPEINSNDKKSHYAAAVISVKNPIDITNNILHSNVDVEATDTQESNACNGVKIVKKISKESLLKTNNKTTTKNVNETSHNIHKCENPKKNASGFSSLESFLNNAGASITNKVSGDFRIVEFENGNNQHIINEKIQGINNNIRKVNFSASLLKSNKIYGGDNNTNNTPKGVDTVPTSNQNVTLMNVVDKSTYSVASKDLNNNSKSQNIDDQTKQCLKEFDEILAEVQRKDSFKNADAEAPSLEDIDDILEKDIDSNFQEIKPIDFNDEYKTKNFNNLTEGRFFKTVITRIHNDASEEKKLDDNSDVISISSDEIPNTDVEIYSHFKAVSKEAIVNDVKEKIKLNICSDDTKSLNTAVELKIIANAKAAQDECVQNDLKDDQTIISKITHDIVKEKIKLENTDVILLNSDDTPTLNTAVEMKIIANSKATQDECVKNDEKADQTIISKITHDIVKEKIKLENADIILQNSDDTPTLNTDVEIQAVVNLEAAQNKLIKNDVNEANETSIPHITDVDSNGKENEQSQCCEEAQILETISINSDSEDDFGYHSSDFEFISEEEAKLDGFIINFNPKTHNFESKIKGQNSNAKKAFSRNDPYAPGPSSRNVGRYKNYRNRKEFVVDKSYMKNYTLPEENEFLNMFHGIIPAMPPCEIHFLENKSVRVRAPMLVQYEGIGFDMNLAMQRVDSSDEEYRDEAEESQKKILEMYPHENSQRKRRRRY